MAALPDRFFDRTTPMLNAIELGDFLRLEIPPRTHLLAPWLPTQGLALVYAPRGVGKTFFALNVAYAVASGGTFLGWQAPQPRGVLYLDGEMSASTMQERLAAIVAAAEREPTAPFRIITPDCQELGMPDLATPEGQAAVGEWLPDADLVVVDNLSTLVRSGKENEAESWLPVQDWALSLRAQGKTVLFVHHAGKGGQQRGSSRREDVLDTVMSLRRPAQYNPEDGAVFDIHFEKARGFYGADAAPCEAKLETLQGAQVWTRRSLEASTYARAVHLAKDGLNVTEIADALGIHKSNVSRHLKKARETGALGGQPAPAARPHWQEDPDGND